jgi:hypothetical protein
VIGRGQVGHPRVIAPDRALPRGRRIVGYVTLAIFLLTFIPVPLITVR